MQFHTVTSNLIPACRPLQSEPLATKLFLYVPSIYLSPSSKFNSNDFDNLITQLPPPILLLGDFNAHSSLRGCSRTDIRGKLVEDLLLKHNLSLLNDGSYTYLHPATGSSSSIPGVKMIPFPPYKAPQTQSRLPSPTKTGYSDF